MKRGTRNTRIGLIVLACLAPPVAAQEPAGLAPVYEGLLYQQGSQRKTLLFRTRIEEDAGAQHRRASFRTPDGVLVAQEEVRMRDNRLVEYQVSHPRAHRSARIWREGGEIRFEYTADGETQRDSEPAAGLVAVGPMIMPLIAEHWASIRAGTPLEFQLAVADRLTTFEFAVRKLGDVEVKGAAAVRLEMEPTNFFVAALVKTVYFTLSRDGKTVYEIEGRVTPLREQGGSFVATDADGVYTRLP